MQNGDKGGVWEMQDREARKIEIGGRNRLGEVIFGHARKEDALPQVMIV